MNLRFPAVVAVVTVAAVTAAYRSFAHAPDALPSSAPAGDLALATPAPTRELLVERHALRTVTVYVAGAVARAGVYALPATGRANDAVRAAGGALGDADLVAVNLAEPLSDGEEIVVPVRGATNSADLQPSTDGARTGGRPSCEPSQAQEASQAPVRGGGRHIPGLGRCVVICGSERGDRRAVADRRYQCSR